MSEPANRRPRSERARARAGGAMIRTVLRGAALAAAMAGGAAAQPEDPDWPCEQRKTPRLSIGQMWSGPSPAEMPAAAADDAIAALAQRIAARRTSLDTVDALVAEVRATPAASRDERLTALFGAVFDILNRERTRLVEGVVRYARGQRALAERIDARETELAALQADAAPGDFDAQDRIEALRDAIAWDARVFEERRDSLRFVCESPVLIEQRVFAVARIVAQAMQGG